MWFIVIVALIVGICTFIHESWDLEFAVPSALIAFLLAGCIAALLVLGVSTTVYDNVEYKLIETQETELVALKDNVMANSYGYLYRGYVNEELKYTYLYDVPGKGITSGRVDADRCYINYIAEGETPRLIKHHYTIKNWFLDFITYDSIVDKIEYNLYVPSGSIVAEGEYNIDLE